jgi:putative glutamine amidotransferase
VSDILVGVSGSIDQNDTRHFLMRDYFLALLRAGATPVMLSPDIERSQAAQCARRLDGLLLAGGGDVEPALFGQQPIEQLGEVTPLRDRAELILIEEFLRLKKPILGICRGVQVMNVALGGSLYQDLPAQWKAEKGKESLLQHRQGEPYNTPCHSVRIEPGSLLWRITGQEELQVNSMHHQAVREMADGFSPCAFAPDGVAEAAEMKGTPFVLGVQWHPERLTDDASRKIFSAFAAACEN